MLKKILLFLSNLKDQHKALTETFHDFFLQMPELQKRSQTSWKTSLQWGGHAQDTPTSLSKQAHNLILIYQIHDPLQDTFTNANTEVLQLYV